MVLSATTLKNGLVNMTPTTSEADAINNFATAWENYFYEATMAAPAVPGSLASSTALMKTAMVGMSTAGAASIQAGVIAFWGGVSASAATIFPPATAAVPPAGITGLAALLLASFVANIAGNLSLSAAATVIASTIHATQTGATGTTPGGPVPIT